MCVYELSVLIGQLWVLAFCVQRDVCCVHVNVINHWRNVFRVYYVVIKCYKIFLGRSLQFCNNVIKLYLWTDEAMVLMIKRRISKILNGESESDSEI